jgi:glycosyltransferase involved in cell wall biosynthesis
MNILLVSDFYPPSLGGIAGYVNDLATSLCLRGHKVLVYTTVGPKKLIVGDGLTVVPVKHIGANLSFLYKQKSDRTALPIPDPLFAKSVKSGIGQFNPDVIHIHGQAMFPLSFFKREWPEIPMVATLHDVGFICPKRDLFYTPERSVCELQSATGRCISCAKHDLGILKSACLVLVYRSVVSRLNCLDCLIAISQSIADKAIAKFNTRIEVVPDFLHLNKPFLSLIEKEMEGEIDVVFGGALIPQKGIYEFLEACSILRRRFPRLKVAVVGFSRSQYNIRLDETNVLVLKNVPRLKALETYKKSKIVVIPSILFEGGQNIIALEAMALSKPVIASDVGGLKETIVNNKTGVLVPPGDSEALARAIGTLLQDHSTLKEMGFAGHDRYKRVFSEERIIPRLEKLYSSITPSLD